MSPIELSLLVSRALAVCNEMGAVLQHAAFSPNIKDRLDFSCALFDPSGALYAQAAHIPVHLGSMAYAMADIVEGIDWEPGDMLVVNDPFLGGTHLPDVTVVSPCFVDGELVSFVANRAHHANIGADTPGSMPISRTLEEEGVVIPPSLVYKRGKVVEEAMARLRQLEGTDTFGDFAAQFSACRVGVARLEGLVGALGVDAFTQGIVEINDYGERLALACLADIPAGEYRFTDYLDDDGCGTEDIRIEVTITVSANGIDVDFDGTSRQVDGNVNCPLSVAAAAVFYCFRCLLPDHAPSCAGTFRRVTLRAEPGTLVNAERPAATAAGNVETSMRIVDTVLGALAQALPGQVPAASQGTMNNIAMGNHRSNHPWDYYETVGGGAGGHARAGGASAVQSHMTNTLNTPIESLEMHFPVRIRRYEIRSGSGGDGARRGGDGIVREYEFLEPAEVTLLTERRRHAPWGLAGGAFGKRGRNLLDGSELPPKCQRSVAAGQVLRVETPGGGGYGEPVPNI
ncbi:MAG: hydantoinase B/oxoprolinase family protein [Pseudomonadales bacterium]|nr:hydantoinase B/oxoprolinase family protein [Pseudomonadales bacterium]